MSKLDQIKALGDAKRAARMNPKRKQPEAKPTKSDDVLASDRVVTRRAMPRSVATTSENLDVTGRRDAQPIRGRGRPKVEGPRPWETAGVSKTTYYRERHRAEPKGTQK